MDSQKATGPGPRSHFPSDSTANLRDIASKAQQTYDEVQDLSRKLTKLRSELSALQNDLITVYQLENQKHAGKTE